MVEKLNNENIKKKDLDLILEVNKKTIEIQMEVADQNEEVISVLNDLKKIQDHQDRKIDKIDQKLDEAHKDLFKIQILFLTGLFSLIMQIIQIFYRK